MANRGKRSKSRDATTGSAEAQRARNTGDQSPSKSSSAQRSSNKKRRNSGKSNRSYDRSRQPGSTGNAGANDISWYSKYPELLAAAGQLPYPYRPGMAVPSGFVAPGGTGAKPVSYGIPGIVCIDWMPSIGFSSTVTSPASIACKELYRKVRSNFSGSIEADPPDFMIYLMALDSIFAAIAHLKRLYRILAAYTPQNYVLPETLYRALARCSAQQFTSDLSQRTRIYGYINELIHMTERFTCPAVMDVFNRHYWMSDNVYTDTSSANAQLYAFRPVGFYQYASLETPQGASAGGLKVVKWSTATNGLLGLCSVVQAMIDALAESDDAYTIAGYLQRAFDGVPSFSVDLLGPDEELVLQYNEEVLSQIENVLALPDVAELDTAIAAGNLNVTQDPKTNTILSKQLVSYAASSTSTWYQYLEQVNVLINIRSDLPTVADSVVATRLKSWLDPVPGSTTLKDYNVKCGTELVAGIYLIDNFGNNNRKCNQFVINGGASVPTSDVRTIAELTAFDWAPLIYIITQSGGADPSYALDLVWDVHNITSVSKATLEELNRVCIYSEFNAFNIS